MQLLRDLFQANFKREPSRKELELYSDYIKSRKMSVNEMNEIIAGNNDVLGRTFYESKSSKYSDGYNPKDPVLGTEDDVILVFNKILDRNPDTTELKYYSKKVKTDKDFSLDKLTQLLISSDEYRRLEKMQTNQAYADTLSGVTDRQLAFVISAIYEEEAKQPIDEDTLRFLKKRYVEFNLDDEMLRKFIRSYLSFQRSFEKDVENASLTGVYSVGKKQNDEPLGSTLSKLYKPQTNDDSKTDEPSLELTLDLLRKSTKTNSNDKEQYTESEKKQMGLSPDSKPNQEMIKKFESLYQKENNSEYLNSSKVIDTIMKDDECDIKNLDKNALEKRLETMDKQLLAELVYNRNMDHMKNVCRRNRKYLNADENMVLFPEFKWQIPTAFPPVCTPLEKNEYQPTVDQTSLIGTLLQDASKTKVGSILPEIPPYN